jgi:broad specificity phosphatase PhoE
MHTRLYLVRHGATEANLARPPRLQGRRHDAPLARLGVRQAEATRDFLAGSRIDVCYSSPLLRAVQTATIIAAPHGLAPTPLEAINECDVGRWEGLDWQTIRYLDAEAHREFMADPGRHGYPGGESFAEVHRRVAPALEQLLEQHAGRTILVGHHVVNRTYLAGLLGLLPGQARQGCSTTVGSPSWSATRVAQRSRHQRRLPLAALRRTRPNAWLAGRRRYKGGCSPHTSAEPAMSSDPDQGSHRESVLVVFVTVSPSSPCCSLSCS